MKDRREKKNGKNRMKKRKSGPESESRQIVIDK